MVLRSVFSLIIFVGASSCTLELTNNTLINLAYQFIGIIMLGLALFTIYSYFISDQQKKVIIRTYAINYLFSIFILISLPGVSNLLCNLQSLFLDPAKANYIQYSINTIQSKSDNILTSLLEAYDIIAQREGRANIPYSFTIAGFGINANTILYIIMSIDQPNLITTAITKSLILPIITYLPYKQYMVYNSVTNKIIRDLEGIYIGLQIHIFILELIRNGLFAGVAIGGVVIRLVPGMKKAGDMLIALGLGMHILYPFIYSVYITAFDEILKPDKSLYNLEYVKNIFLNKEQLYYYFISVNQLMIITLPNLALAVVAAFSMNAYKTFDFIESI